MSEEIDVPDGLSADAEDMFRDVLEQHPEMAAHQFHSLIQAARLVSLADEMESQVQGAYLVPGYKGQPVANGLLTETRLARAAAVTALKSAGLGVPGKRGSSQEAGRALARARWDRRGA